MNQIKIKGKNDHNCHGNSLRNKKLFGLKIFKGLLVNKKDKTATPHFFNTYKGKIFDKSVGYDKDNEYYGKEVEKDYSDANVMYEKELDSINIQQMFSLSANGSTQDLIEVNNLKKV